MKETDIINRIMTQVEMAHLSCPFAQLACSIWGSNLNVHPKVISNNNAREILEGFPVHISRGILVISYCLKLYDGNLDHYSCMRDILLLLPVLEDIESA